MKLPAALTDWLEQHQLGRVVKSATVGGGCISEALCVTTEADERFFLKLNASVPDDFFLAEARSLQILGRSQCLRVPEVHHAGPDFILMEWIEPGTPKPGFWAELGEALARLHSQPADRFGFAFATYCGSNVQPNDWCNDGYRFFAEYRLIQQARMARDRNLLERGDTRRLEALCQRLPELLPHQPPALLHGDLWSGNVHCTSTGSACLIDPAAYYGWPEADLAMTRLFGGFGADFLPTYGGLKPLEPGFEQRAPLYNLYHLLNHLNLFGTRYQRQIRDILSRFAD